MHDAWQVQERASREKTCSEVRGHAIHGPLFTREPLKIGFLRLPAIHAISECARPCGYTTFQARLAKVAWPIHAPPTRVAFTFSTSTCTVQWSTDYCTHDIVVRRSRACTRTCTKRSTQLSFFFSAVLALSDDSVFFVCRQTWYGICRTGRTAASGHAFTKGKQGKDKESHNRHIYPKSISEVLQNSSRLDEVNRDTSGWGESWNLPVHWDTHGRAQRVCVCTHRIWSAFIEVFNLEQYSAHSRVDVIALRSEWFCFCFFYLK